jgi:hypothetical protein
MEAAPEGPLPFPPSRASLWKQVPPYALLACVLVLAIAPRFIFAKQSEWQQVYVDSARQLRDGEGLFGAGQPYVYPPFMAAAATPFSFLSERWSRALWLMLNSVALVVCMRCAWRLAGGESRLPLWRSPRSEHWILWLGLACGGYYIIDSLGHQQTDLVIAALLFRGCLAMRDERWLLGGVLLGIAAGCKCTPLLFAPYFIWRGRWLACLTMLLTAVAINLLPDLIHSAPAGGTWLQEWWRTYIAPQVRGDALPGVWASEVIYNQSLAGALNRWTQTRWSWEPAGIVVGPSANSLSPFELKQMLRAIQLAIAALAFVLFLHRPFRSIVEANRTSSENRYALECSIVLILMLLFSPMSSKPHFCTLLLPGFCLARNVIRANRPAALACVIAAAIVCGLLANKDLVKARIYTLVLWYGLVTISAALLGVACGLALVENRKEHQASAEVELRIERAAA